MATINLEALANESRAAGENYITIEDGVLKVYSGCTHDEDDDFVCSEEWVCVDNTGDVWTGDLFPGDPMLVYPYLAIIARHLGAGQPVAADRAALVERAAEAGYAADERLVPWEDAGRNTRQSFRDIVAAALAVVEAAGWEPRAEPVAGTGETLYRRCPHCPGDGTSCWTCDDEGYVPVAPPEPLSAGEIAAMAEAGSSVSARNPDTVFALVPPDMQRDWMAATRAVLAALPRRRGMRCRHAVPAEVDVMTDWLDPIRLGCYVVGVAVGFALGRWT